MAGFGRGKIYEEYYKPYVVSNSANTTFYTFLILISAHSNAPKLLGFTTGQVRASDEFDPIKPCYCAESYPFWKKLTPRPYEPVFWILCVIDKDPDLRNRTAGLRIRIPDPVLS
jgi:hypothetical protein